jgi:deazaflavin-dependent oxidoreductase (nitroreductase family)
MSSHHRRKGYRFQGMDVLFLTTIGRKSGQPRETPVAWFPDGDAWLIVASAAGAAQHPGWYRNIAARPDEVWIELADRTLKVTSELLHGQEREERWQRIVAAQPRYHRYFVAAQPRYHRYQDKTDRELPVIRLTPSTTA